MQGIGKKKRNVELLTYGYINYPEILAPGGRVGGFWIEKTTWRTKQTQNIQ